MGQFFSTYGNPNDVHKVERWDGSVKARTLYKKEWLLLIVPL